MYQKAITEIKVNSRSTDNDFEKNADMLCLSCIKTIDVTAQFSVFFNIRFLCVLSARIRSLYLKKFLVK